MRNTGGATLHRPQEDTVQGAPRREESHPPECSRRTPCPSHSLVLHITLRHLCKLSLGFSSVSVFFVSLQLTVWLRRILPPPFLTGKHKKASPNQVYVLLGPKPGLSAGWKIFSLPTRYRPGTFVLACLFPLETGSHYT